MNEAETSTAPEVEIVIKDSWTEYISEVGSSRLHEPIGPVDSDSTASRRLLDEIGETASEYSASKQVSSERVQSPLGKAYFEGGYEYLARELLQLSFGLTASEMAAPARIDPQRAPGSGYQPAKSADGSRVNGCRSNAHR